jgi:two-component system, NarL family, response regulator NreC
MALRVLLADDHEVVRDGLKALLSTKGFDVVGEASNGRDAVRLTETTHPDVAILDLSMPHLNGIDAARIIARRFPNTRPILLTIHTEDPYVMGGLRAGVRGYVLKTQAGTDLVHAIREVSMGGIYLSPGVSRAVVDAFLTKRDAPMDPLSAREREVLQLVAEGKTNKEVAAVLGISVKTAECHRGHIMGKLNLHDTASLVRYAIRNGLAMP